jgi:CubicO group peptidase (beta-lactamase class C family)
MAELPQLTALGQVFAYNNAAVVLAGRLVESATGKPYEEAVQDLVIGPLGLEHTFYYSDALIGYNVAASHGVDAGRPVVQPSFWRLWRSLHPTGGLISSARDQLRYARFHLGDGVATTGSSVLSPAAIRAMRAELGPGGTLGVEIDGVGVTWWQRRTAEGVPVFQHGGAWPGQHSGFYFVPDRGFALTALTNSDGGAPFIAELFYTDDGALRPFAGLSNPPAIPQTLTSAELAPYEGRYLAREVDPPPGDTEETWFELRAVAGRLRARKIAGDDQQEFDLAFYRDNYVVVLDDHGEPTAARADFVPGPNGRITWFRVNGRLHTRQD